MKTIQLITLTMLLFFLTTHAQDNKSTTDVNKNTSDTLASKKTDTLKFSIGKSVVWIMDRDSSKIETKKKKTEKFNCWNGIGIGINGFMNSSGNTTPPANYDFLELNYNKSLSFNWNFADLQIPIYKNYVSLVTGLGLEFNAYNFRKPITLDQISETVEVAFYDSTTYYSKNKLKATYLEVPLLLEFNTNKKQSKSFHLAAGIIAGYKIGSKTKQIFEKNGEESKVKRKGDYNLNPFRYGATVRIGYDDVSLFANYSLSTLFEKGRGPDIYPFAVGLSFSL